MKVRAILSQLSNGEVIDEKIFECNTDGLSDEEKEECFLNGYIKAVQESNERGRTRIIEDTQDRKYGIENIKSIDVFDFKSGVNIMHIGEIQ